MRLRCPEYLPIFPLPEGIARPTWSVMIPTYNCADYLRITLKGLLDQDPGPEQMQIEVVDDVSTKDEPEAVVQELGKGRVSFFRQARNVGPQGNFTSCIERSRGKLVHILHGDDAVLPGFYRHIEEGFSREQDAGAAFCRVHLMDENGRRTGTTPLQKRSAGVLDDFYSKITSYNRIPFPSMVVKREVYERIGGFHPDLIHTSDWDMWKRVAASYPMWYDPEPLVEYRIHSSSDTSRLMRSGANVADKRRSIEISEACIAAPFSRELANRARAFLALDALKTAGHMISVRDASAALAQTREAIKCCRPLRVAGIAAYLGMLGAARRLRRGE